jgi:hypothetical protein
VFDEHLRTLGLPPGANPERIRAAYRRLAKACHPDKFAHDPRLQADATARMKAINAAYDALAPLVEGPSAAPTRRKPRTFDPMDGRPYRSGRPAQERAIPEWHLGWLTIVFMVLTILAKAC